MTAATLYGVGVGPGDPELITLKAARILKAVPVIAYPAPLSGDSLARRLAAPHLPGGQAEIVLRFAFDPAAPPPEAVYDAGAAEIAERLEAGDDVAVLCEGDPLFFGSFAYLLERLGGRFRAVVVPGVASPMACAAVLGQPLASRDDIVAVLPATRPDLEAALEACDVAVVMKLGRHLDRVRALLIRHGFDGAIVVRAGQDGQSILPLSAATVPYFSMLIARRRAK